MVVEQVVAVASSLNVQAVLLFVVVLLLTVAWIRRPRNLPPGPRAWPLLGNLREMQGSQMYFVFARWAKNYGSVMSVWMGPRLAIVLNDIDAVKEALVKQADCFSDRPDASRDMPVKGSIIMENGDSWKEQRRFGLSAMRNLGMGKRSVEHKINEEARHLLESFDGEGEKPFDPEHAILNAVSNIICTISFGYRFEYSDPKFANLIKVVKTNLTTTSVASVGSLLFGIFQRTKVDERRKRLKTITDFIREIIQEHRQSFDPNDIRDVIDMYLLEIDQRECGGKDKETAIQESTIWRGIYDLFVAGTDTTTNTLLWLVMYMAVYPDVQKRVQKEIDDVIGTDRQPTSEDSNSMPYINGVLMEMQRQRPVVPSGVPHLTHYQTELLGYSIPAQTVVIVNLWNILHDPKSWKDPEKFDPTRFLSEDGKTVKKPEAFIPFSFGRRICLGETLAKNEMFLFFVNLLQRFTFSLPAGKPRPSLEGIAGITMAPHSYEIVAKKR